MSSGMQGVLRDALGWVAAAALLALTITNFDAIRAFNRQMLGIENSDTPNAAVADRSGNDVASSSRTSGRVELAANDHGHYAAEADINGRHISLMVDTGASLVVLTYDDAMRAGVYVRDSDFTAQSRTANGIAKNAIVTLNEVCIESVCVKNVKAMVAERDRLHISLLGMTFLSRLQRVDIKSGRLTLEN